MYHIVYLKIVAENVYTGVNIAAKDVSEALRRFEKKFGKQEIHYICKKDI